MKTIDLEFEDYPGIYTVTVSPVPMAAFESAWALHLAGVRLYQETGDLAGLRATIAEFGKVAQPKWNGKSAKLLDLDPNLVIEIVRQWHAGVRSVPLPLLRRSGSTASSLAE